jgi:hypothetical protein
MTGRGKRASLARIPHQGGSRSRKLLVGLRKPSNSDFHRVILHNVLSRPKPQRHIGLLDPPYALVRNARYSGSMTTAVP